jgi:hypothetical protein
LLCLAVSYAACFFPTSQATGGFIRYLHNTIRRNVRIPILTFHCVATVAVAAPLDTSYVLPKELSDWTCQAQSFVKSGRRVTSYAIYSPTRSHVITIGFVSGYSDREITNDHFEALVTSFAREGMKEVRSKERVSKYGLPGAQVVAHGFIQGKEFTGKGTILKSDESELTIMAFAIGIPIDDPEFTKALAGLGIAGK